MSNEKPNIGGEYKYGFKDKDVSIVKTPKGINEDIVKEISTLKNEQINYQLWDVELEL